MITIFKPEASKEMPHVAPSVLLLAKCRFPVEESTAWPCVEACNLDFYKARRNLLGCLSKY